jgi:D-apiose dehydrogenase
MERIRLAVVGTGYFSQFHYEAWSRIPEVQLVALACRTNLERAKQVADTYGVGEVFCDVEQMLQSAAPDLVDVVTPPASHLTFVKLACARRIPAITQKPLAPTLAESLQIRDAARSTGTLVVVHDNWRFKPWFREMKRIIEAGAIGDTFNASFRFRPGDGQGPCAYLDRQPYFRDMGRFLVHETLIHLIDVFRFFFGEITTVSADLRRLNPAIAGEDAGYLALSFANGTLGLIDGNRLADFEAEQPRLTLGEMIIEGTLGELRLDGHARLHFRKRGQAPTLHPYHWVDRGYGGDCVFALQKHVVDHMTIGSLVENSAEEYITNVFVEEAAYESNSAGKRIDFDMYRSTIGGDC